MTVFHLSPHGNDEADGTAAKATRNGSRGPWKTFSGARNALRKLRASGALHGEATVVVQNGHYPISNTIEFTAEDSHTVYQAGENAQPVIDGARVLDGWTETTHGKRRAWVLDLPEVKSGHWYFRSLFVEGSRRPRARYPKFSPDAKGAEHTFRIEEMRFPENRDLFAGDHFFKPAAKDFQNWPSLTDAEIVLLHYWVETRLPDPQFNPETGWVRCSRRSVFNLYESFNPLLARYYVDNLFEALSEPGEWYLNRSSGRLTYLPMAGETLENTQVCAPLVTRFLEVHGEAFNRGPNVRDPYGPSVVEKINFRGLTFRHSDWYQPASEMIPHDATAAAAVHEIPLGSAPQSAAHVPAAIDYQWAKNCNFTHNTVEHTGFTAVEVGKGCRNLTISNNKLHQLGGGGVKISGVELDGPTSDRTGGIRFTDNTVVHVGRVFHQSCGILLTHAFDCDLSHNEIAHTCYTGISCGWSWGYRETITRDIRIENNHLHDICEGVLSDNGGIYLLGVQPGTIIRGNHIHHITAADYGGWGIYPDEGSSHMVFEQNWIHDTLGSCFNIHFSRELVVRNNVFARPGDSFVGVGRVENHIAATVVSNVFLGPAKSLYSAAYRGDIRRAVHTNANAIGFDEKTIPPSVHPDWRDDVPHQISFQEWLAAGHDRLSQVGALKYKETKTNLSFPKNSPVFLTGFRAFDWSICGPRI